MSRIGKYPVVIPEGVTASVNGNVVNVKGKINCSGNGNVEGDVESNINCGGSCLVEGNCKGNINANGSVKVGGR